MKKTKPNTAVIFGVTGQDGSYLAEYLLGLDYKVLGVQRRSSTDTTGRLEGVIGHENFTLTEGDITDYASVSGVLSQAFQMDMRPVDEVYNLAAQSHVHTSFEQPLFTSDVNYTGVLNILENLRRGSGRNHTRFYQASTSEMFGDNYEFDEVRGELIQTEDTQFQPQSPYAIAKVAAHQAVRLYRQSYGIFGCCGILFNHESERRGENFVTRKITRYVGRLYHLRKDLAFEIPKLQLGNLASHRDWGYAPDFVRAMHKMLQMRDPDDYLVATGESQSVADFCEAAFDVIGISNWKKYVEVNPKFIRPSEVPHLQGVPDKANKVLRWEPQITFREMVRRMVVSDIELARHEYQS